MGIKRWSRRTRQATRRVICSRIRPDKRPRPQHSCLNAEFRSRQTLQTGRRSRLDRPCVEPRRPPQAAIFKPSTRICQGCSLFSAARVNAARPKQSPVARAASRRQSSCRQQAADGGYAARKSNDVTPRKTASYGMLMLAITSLLVFRKMPGERGLT